MDKIRFGVIGVGAMGASHLASLTKKDEVKVVCIADINEEVAKAQMEKYGIGKYVTDYDELLAMKEIDAVVVGIPTHLHRDAVTKAAKAGKHIFCEKPMAMNLRDTDEMIQSCEQAGVILQIGFVMRFSSDRLKLRELLREDVIGRPVLWRMVFAFNSGGIGEWVFKKEQGGGPFIEGGIHHFDFTRYTFGEVKRVMATTKRLNPEKGTAWDTGTAILQFEGGDEILISFSWALPGYNWEIMQGFNRYDIIGPKGTILFPSPKDESVITVTPYGKDEGKAMRYPWRHDWGVTSEAYEEERSHFIDCIKSNKSPRATGLDGKKALEIALAVFKSAQTGQSVNL